jgi:hypothetical protein
MLPLLDDVRRLPAAAAVVVVVVLGVLTTAGGVVSAIVLCVLNDNSKISPATVLATARMTRRMVVLLD